MVRTRMTSNKIESTQPSDLVSTPAPSRVAVIGPGGVGGLVGALITRAGHRVIFIGREPTVRTLQDNGIWVSSLQFGDFTVRVEAETELREHVDACLITVKQTALAEVLQCLPPAKLGKGLVVPLLNGIEHPAALRTRYPRALVAPGVIRVESARVAPGRIIHGSPFVEIDLASTTTPRARLEALGAVFTSAGIQTQLQKDEFSMLWNKMYFLAPFALMTTLYQRPIGVVRTEHRRELVDLLDEIGELSRLCGVRVDASAAMRLYDAFPADAKSSMQRDAEAGQPLELDAIGGALLRVAERYDTEAPLVKRLVQDLVRRQ